MSKLTLGPLLFNWSANKRRDFYFRMADEAPIDVVYFGEAVCSKREPFSEPVRDAVIERLTRAGKQVVASTLSLITSPREREAISKLSAAGALIEANDVACVQALGGKPFVIGPFVNVFNEGSLAFLMKKGAVRLCFSMEMGAKAMGVLAKATKKLETEAMVFGRQPISVSMRCYHARANGLNKDACQFICGQDEDGLAADTITGQKLLTINGTVVMSHGYVVLLDDLADLQKKGVSYFRLSPQNVDMLRVAEIYRAVLDKKTDPATAQKQLRGVTGDVSFVNGFMRGREGLAWASGED